MIKKLYYSKNFYLRSVLYAGLSMAAAALSYALYPFLIHLLPREVFGDVAASLAIASQLASIFLAFNLVSLYIAKKYRDSHERLEQLQRRVVRIFLVLSAILLLTSPYLTSLLQFGNYRSFVALMLVVLLSVPAVIWMGYLQGKEEMARVGVYTFAAAAFKFIFAVILAIIFKSDIALFGIVLGQLAGIILLAKLPGNKVPSIKSIFTRDAGSRLKEKGLTTYLFVCTFVCILMSFVQNADILFAKSLLDPFTSGTYVAISSLGNIAFYTGFLLVWITLSGLNLKNRTLNSRLLARSATLLSAMSLAIFILFNIFEDFILRDLVGQVAPEFYGQLGKNVIYQSLIALSTLIIYSGLLLRKRGTIAQTFGFCLPILSVPLFYNSEGPGALVNLVLNMAILGFTLQCIILVTQKYVWGSKT